jgi:hypothetical protein
MPLKREPRNEQIVRSTGWDPMPTVDNH